MNDNRLSHQDVLYRPRLRLTAGGHRDFQVVIGEMVLALIEVFPREAHPANCRRTPTNRAVQFVLARPAGGMAYQQASLQQTADYLKGLGIDPKPLWELAGKKGWAVPEEVA